MAMGHKRGQPGETPANSQKPPPGFIAPGPVGPTALPCPVPEVRGCRSEVSACGAIFYWREKVWGKKKGEQGDAGIWGCCAGVVCFVSIRPQCPPSPWCEAVSQPEKKKNNPNRKKKFPTQKAGAEFGISGKRGGGNIIILVYYYFPRPKKSNWGCSCAEEPGSARAGTAGISTPLFPERGNLCRARGETICSQFGLGRGWFDFHSPSSLLVSAGAACVCPPTGLAATGEEI